jgi:ribosomal protein S18 acetylase RimI-like enzyme
MLDRPTPQETESLVALAQATGFFNPEEIAVVRELLDEYHARGEASGYFWAVYRASPGAPPVGFVCYGPVPMSEDVYDLYWIAVDPRRQSGGIGSALLAFVEAELSRRRARQLYIETSDTPRYAPTRAFYERRGYEEVAHLTDYYHVGDGKLVYRKVLA